MVTTVAQLIAELQKHPAEMPVRVAVGWAADTAISDEDDVPSVKAENGVLIIEGWLSNCNTELEWPEDELEEEEQT